LSIFAALVAGVNLGRGIGNKDKQLEVSPTPQLSPASTLPRILQYDDDTCGISFEYPETMTKTESGLGGAIFTNKEKSDETIIVACQKDIPRPALIENRIESVKIGSVSAKLYHDGSEKDGTPIDKLIFTHPKKIIDIYIAGIGETYNLIIKSLVIN